ncbi:MAG: HAMP domain-containing histidine kinase [Planctomycetes bacterium]|nr:HAMP domain-containing histidine kinase [Planctomycetota bacterium]
MSARVRHLLPRPPTIRMLVALWVASVLIVWTILVGGWIVAKDRLARIGTQVTTDIQAMDATHKLEAAILSYRHDNLLWHSTDQNSYEQDERGSLATAEQIADNFARYVSTPTEEELLAKIQKKLSILRSQLSVAAPGPTQIEAGSTFDLLGVLHDLQIENEGQMEASIQAANRVQNEVSDWATGLSVGTAVLLFAGALNLMRRIIRPTLALTKAAQSFGQGDFSAKAPVLHDDEMGNLARTFNNMAGDIADREKNRLEFVAMVVHDLKNPVLAIDMAARLLQRADALEEEHRGYLKGIQEETAHLRGIIRDLTDDIQVTNGRFSLHKVEIDLGALVRQFSRAQGRTFTAHEIAVQTEEGCMIQGDARRIERVVMNLLSNAVKYSPPNTRITVQVRKEDSQAVLTVSDQGPGIAEDDLGVLFQPFGRGRSAEALAEGTGMGLYVVKQIVEAHGGRIEVQSKLGHGTTFCVRLPLASAKILVASTAQV